MNDLKIKEMVDQLYKEVISNPWILMNSEKGNQKLDLICHLSILFETPEEKETRIKLFNQRMTEIMGEPYNHVDPT